MKLPVIRTLSLAALLAAGIPHANADVILVQEMDMAGEKSTMTMSIKGNKLRTDNGTLNSVIIDTDTGDMTSLMHEQKMAVTVKGSVMKAAQAQVTGQVEPPKPEATGTVETIDGHACEIYILKAGGTESKMWVAKDYPGYDHLKKELAAIQKMGAGSAKLPEPPGMVLKTETNAGGMKIVTTLVSLKETPVDDAIFTPPADYKAPGQ